MGSDVSGFVVPAAATPWGRALSVTIYRKKVMHRTAKNYQLDLFDPNDGYYEYSAITSNLDYTVARNVGTVVGLHIECRNWPAISM